MEQVFPEPAHYTVQNLKKVVTQLERELERFFIAYGKLPAEELTELGTIDFGRCRRKNMEARPLKMGNIEAKVPLIQGGMGVGISLGRLAGAVAKEGGIGIISAAQIGFKEPDLIRIPKKRTSGPFKRNTTGEGNRAGWNHRI